VSGTFEKREERQTGKREWSGERKSNKLAERGAAFQPAPAPLACSGCNLQALQTNFNNLASLAVKLASCCNQSNGTKVCDSRATRHNAKGSYTIMR
jgi:hypothetical protein